MPTGRYTVMDGDGNAVGTEDFRCARGPAGWRYASDIRTTEPEPHAETVDLAVDTAWSPVRLRIATGRHEIVLRREDDRFAGIRDGGPVEVPWRPGRDLDYLSPAFNAVTTNRLRRSSAIEVVFLEPVTCLPRPEPQRYELIGDEEVGTPVGTFLARRWRYTALSTGWTRDLWVAGDVVVRYEGLYELVWYEAGGSGPRPLA
jgi:hypothetical protein